MLHIQFVPMTMKVSAICRCFAAPFLFGGGCPCSGESYVSLLQDEIHALADQAATVVVRRTALISDRVHLVVAETAGNLVAEDVSSALSSV